MKLLRVGLVLLSLCLLFGASPVRALETTPHTPKPESPVMITSYAATGSRLEYVQLHNPEDAPIDMSGWKMEYVIEGQDEPVLVAVLDGWLSPSNYIVAGEESAVPSADFSYRLSTSPEITGSVVSIRVTSPKYADIKRAIDYDSRETVGEPFCPENATATNYWQRNVSDSTGNYTSSFNCFVPDDSYRLFIGGMYDFPADTSLQVSEILPNPRECSPVSGNMKCREYVKLYNPSSQPVDLSQFRLRIGHQGQNSTNSNTYYLDGSIAPGQYAVITRDTEDRPLSLADGGNFVWLEDTYGLKAYGGTVASYPNATSVTKEGTAWAYDARDGKWKWTTQPTPGNQPSVFVPLPVETKKAASSQLKPCRPGQYRSKETNRCRSIAGDAANSLVPCRSGQVRNLETNRCRKIASSASALVPCKPHQERNPETNRCKNKKNSIPEAAFAVTPVKETGKAFAGWWALGGVGTLAVGYGAWEWRREAANAIRKAGSFIIGGK